MVAAGQGKSASRIAGPVFGGRRKMGARHGRDESHATGAPQRDGRLRAGHLMFLAAGAATGVVVVASTGVAATSGCPTTAEGGTLCELQRGLVRPALAVMGCITAAHILARMLLDVVPDIVGHLRAGDRLRIRRSVPIPPYTDPAVAAAGWGDMAMWRLEARAAQNGTAVPRTQRQARTVPPAVRRDPRPIVLPDVRTPAPADQAVKLRALIDVVAEAGETATPPRHRESLAVCIECLTIVEDPKSDSVCPACGGRLTHPPRIGHQGSVTARHESVEAGPVQPEAQPSESSRFTSSSA